MSENRGIVVAERRATDELLSQMSMIFSVDQPRAAIAPMNDPMLQPPIRSISNPAACRPSSTPMCANPRAPAGQHYPEGSARVFARPARRHRRHRRARRRRAARPRRATRDRRRGRVADERQLGSAHCLRESTRRTSPVREDENAVRLPERERARAPRPRRRRRAARSGSSLPSARGCTGSAPTSDARSAAVGPECSNLGLEAPQDGFHDARRARADDRVHGCRRLGRKQAAASLQLARELARKRRGEGRVRGDEFEKRSASSTTTTESRTCLHGCGARRAGEDAELAEQRSGPDDADRGLAFAFTGDDAQSSGTDDVERVRRLVHAEQPLPAVSDRIAAVRASASSASAGIDEKSGVSRGSAAAGPADTTEDARRISSESKQPSLSRQLRGF